MSNAGGSEGLASVTDRLSLEDEVTTIGATYVADGPADNVVGSARLTVQAGF